MIHAQTEKGNPYRRQLGKHYECPGHSAHDTVRRLADDRYEGFFFHPEFPVDVRHNAKIFREKLAVWAAHQSAKT